MSSSEAEYVVLSADATEAVWIDGVLKDLNAKGSTSTTIFEDNRGSICMAKNMENKRTKHIDVKQHFIRDLLTNGMLRVEPIGTQDQLADVFTKALDVTRFRTLRTKLGMSD